MIPASIDDLLADAAVPTSSAPFDVAAGLRRLATDAARGVQDSELAQVERARHKLDVVSRWVLKGPGAAAHVRCLAEDPARAGLSTEEQLDVEGALVFACLLYLTEHPESAQFWWQLAAGAGERTAAYCLHLHHIERGEPREARHWFHQATRDRGEAGAASPPDDGFFAFLDVFTQYVRKHGSSVGIPTASLAAEVDRLASRSRDACGIVSRPDRRLADHLHDVADHR